MNKKKEKAVADCAGKWEYSEVEGGGKKAKVGCLWFLYHQCSPGTFKNHQGNGQKAQEATEIAMLLKHLNLHFLYEVLMLERILSKKVS